MIRLDSRRAGGLKRMLERSGRNIRLFLLSRRASAAGRLAAAFPYLGGDRRGGGDGLRSLPKLQEGTPRVGLRRGRGWLQTLG